MKDLMELGCHWWVNRTPLLARSRKVAGEPGMGHAFRQGYDVRDDQGIIAASAWRPGKPFAPRSLMMAMQNLFDDFEGFAYRSERGLRNLVGNVTTCPANHTCYRPDDFERDTIRACRNGGGQPDILLVSSNFFTIFPFWRAALTWEEMPVNPLGIRPEAFRSPLFPGVSIVPAPLLTGNLEFSALCLTSDDVVIEITEGLADSGKGLTIGGRVRLRNPDHHAFVTGITAFYAG